MPHVVKRGETLGKIARANGVTLDQLLDANPQFRPRPDIIHVGDVVIIPGEEPGPLPPPPTTPSAFTGRLASVARGQHDRFQFVNEADPILCGQIKKWTEDIGGAFVSCTSNAHPWSAVFVYVARPIFIALLAAWLWRLILLFVLLKRIAALDLAVVPTHPDHCGGLGFVEKLPAVFSLFAFSVSAVLASRLAHDVVYHGVHVQSLRLLVGCS